MSVLSIVYVCILTVFQDTAGPVSLNLVNKESESEFEPKMQDHTVIENAVFLCVFKLR